MTIPATVPAAPAPTGELIGARELDGLLRSATPPLLLDVRWQLVASRPEDPAHPVGYGDYLEAHLPGAVFVDLGAELAGAPSPEAGRHPLPSADAFAASVARWGLADGQLAVVYDDQGGLSAARAWWLLRHAGLPVRVLDGGIQAWIAAGGDTEEGAVTPPAPAVAATVGWGEMPVLDADAAAALAETGVLLDARAEPRYLGLEEPIDPRAGHIPGAVSAPTAGNLGPGRRFLTPAQLGERFAALGVSADGAPVGAYCGSGVTASHELLALAVAGVGGALYPGSWSQWSNDPLRPVATSAGA
ncbi:sulfurtransferase [Galactobacter valiniphilus]|uniref:Sulfurtransferase n=1 Tax=Galactobacter valiniphilus TaxID=2676122 RepID=A0A399JBV1_9MICC|nr:sulfurtransferase [Galactobacter valiniphilus]RII43045.1 sulfurtransferase [Galactobacter valiniphilus]